ncbi:MAG TPA: GAF and ANTAR domain-containing protein [Mycobacteriales bacterium]|nr:GAF and ANTAR domain-containing protein [Mycobacteriales bacterium]
MDEPQVGAVEDALRARASSSDDLARALVELSAVLVDEEPLPDVLQRVADLAVAVVPGCDGAGVTLVEDGRASTAAHTDDVVLAVDQQQYDAGDGPCLAAVRERAVHSVALDEAEQRWPDFAARARALGVRSFLAAPLVAGGRAVGSLNLYSRSPDGFDALDDVLVAMFCGQASVALANARLYARALDLNAQLSSALETRAVIERAKGVLMAQQGVDEDAAFAQLRAWSQSRNTKLRDVAAEVVAGACGVRGATA